MAQTNQGNIRFTLKTPGQFLARAVVLTPQEFGLLYTQNIRYVVR
jgi:hypothetical protein